MIKNSYSFKSIFRVGLVIVTIFSIASIFFIKNIDVVKGIAIGFGFANFNLKLIERSVRKSVVSRKPFGVGISGYLFRYIITGTVLYISIIQSVELFFGTVIGLLSIKGSIVLISIGEALKKKGGHI